ncbi:MAG: hypothetical protein ACR2QT_07920 [Woeseiaceae bacterium]
MQVNAEEWYRNPWVWLLIAIPSLTVVGCALTIYLAISRPHTIVHDSAAPASTAPGISNSDAE